MELVHRGIADIGVLAEAQGILCEDLCRAADDRRLGIDHGIACDHADIVLPEDIDHLEELLRDKCLDGGGVVAPLSSA